MVAKEIKVNDRPDLFAATPPLEALKLITSFTASGRGAGKCMMHNDVSRAYFHAPAVRNVFVEIAHEDREAGDENKCGWLNMSMYGTRDAASNWEGKYSTVLINAGFKRGESNPCVFRHDARDIDTLLHGDDYVSSAALPQLD